MDTPIRSYNMNSGPNPSLSEEQQAPSRQAELSDDTSMASIEAEATKLEAGVTLVQPVVPENPEKVDVADFETIFQRFQGPITNFIYHLVGNREQAYDLTQDVFVKAYRALLGGTAVQPAALSAWLYRIASNTATDALRRRRLIAWLPMSMFNEDRGIGAGVISDAGGTSTDTFTTNSEEYRGDARSSSVSTLYERSGYDGGRFESRVADREIVERVFQQLPPKYAICLWLYENDGRSCAEIADVLKISPSAVKMRLMRARERFIGLYQKEVGED